MVYYTDSTAGTAIITASAVDRGDSHRPARGGREVAVVPLVYFQLLSAALFVIGLYGVLARRSAVLIVMSIELMLNAVNINLIATASHLGYNTPAEAFANFDGQIIAIFVITVAAAEVGLALAIILRIYRNRSTINVDEIDLMKW
jgi:NADH:ubiquinone oxidoreductase subunit K